jgi:hypothetical protein
MWGVGIQLHSFLTLVIDGHEWSASCSDHLTVRKRASGANRVGEMAGPRPRLNILGKSLWPLSGIYPESAVQILVIALTMLSRLSVRITNYSLTGIVYWKKVLYF